MECTKKVLEAEMLESVHARYPECSTKSYILPIIPFRKPIYKTIPGRSFPTSVTDQRVREQTKTDGSTLLGSHTETLVSKCLVRISESSDNEPMFVLLGYNLDNYLCGLEDKRVKETKTCVQNYETSGTETGSTEISKGRAERIPKDKKSKKASKAGKTKSQTEDSHPQGQNDPDYTRTQSAKTGTISKSQSRKKEKLRKDTGPVTSNNHSEDFGTSETVQKEAGMTGESKDTESTISHLMDTVTTESTRPQTRHALSQQQTSKDTSAMEDSTLTAQPTEHTVNIETEKQEKPSKKKRKKYSAEEQRLQACFDELEERAKEITPRCLFPKAQDFDLPSLCRAEYDALIISRNYGLVVIETKTMKDRETAGELNTESERGSCETESNSKVQASKTNGSSSENETEQDREQPNRNNIDHHTSCDQGQTQGSKLEVRREGSTSGTGGYKMKQMSLDDTVKGDRNETKNTSQSSLKNRCQLGQSPIDIPFVASSQQTDGCFVDTAFETDLTKSEGNSSNIAQQADAKETAKAQASHEIDNKKTKRNGTENSSQTSQTVQGENLQDCFENSHELSQTETPKDEANEILQTNLTQTSQDQIKDTDFETDLKKTVTKALKQLKKAGLVLKYLTSDVTHKPAVTKVLALPCVSRSRLRTTLQDNLQLVQAMCECLETDTFEEALTRCLCADETKRYLEQDKDRAPQQLEALEKWWTEMMSGIRAGTDKTSTEISMDSYEEILSRFCGKYSKVEGHSVADCIHLTGVHFGRSILRQEQLDILLSKDDFVFLSGPPGSGKTLLLGLKATERAKAGDVVIIVCSKGVNMGSLVSWQLYRRVKEALGWKRSEEELAKTAENRGLGVKKLEQEAESRKTAENEVLLCNGSKVEHEQTSGSLKESENNSIPKPKKKKWKKKTSPKKAPSLADNVHLEFISSETNIHDFLENILYNYGASGQNLRFIVDEVQKEVTEESQIQRLRDGLLRLKKIQEVYLEIADQLEAKSEEEANAKAQHNPQDHKTVSDQQHLQPEAKHIMELFQTMKKRQGYMFHRLAKLEPKPGGLPLMGSAEWKDLMRSINAVYNETVILCEKLHETVVDGVQQGTLDKASVKEKLEKADLYMVSAMGFLYHAFNFLLFFLTDQLFGTLKNMQSTGQQRQVSVWTSSIYPYYSPHGFEVKRLTCCLRCPPAVQEIMSLTQNSVKCAPKCCYVSKGCESELPLPSDGLGVKWIDHAPHMTSETEVNDCQECGRILADYLLNDLRIGQQGDPDGLTIEDVLISGSPIHQSDCRFVQELRGRGIDTQYENQELKAPPPYPNKALIMGGGTIQGLEAKIVVYVPEIRRIELTRKDMITLKSNPQSNDHGTSPSKDQQQPDKAENSCSNYLTEPSGEELTKLNGGQEVVTVKVPAVSDAVISGTVGEGGGGINIPSGRIEEAVAMVGTAKKANGPLGMAEGSDDASSGMASDTDAKKLQRLGGWNREYLWQVASRSVSHLIVFHI